MRLQTEKIVVKLGEPGDEAVLGFERLRVNVINRVVSGLKKTAEASEAERMEAFRDYQAAILGSCCSVENLFVDDKPVTVEDVRAANVYQSLIDLIMMGYAEATRIAEPEAEAKNADSSAAS